MNPLWWLGILPLMGFTGFYLWVLYSGLADWKTLPKLEDVRLNRRPEELSRFSLDIVIPARNEETKLGRCLESLEHQTFCNFQVWMVDDRSTDATGEIMRRFASEDDRFHVIEGIDPPEGWVGKVNAIAQALPHLSAEWVLFLDADTWLHPENLERAITYAQKHYVDLLTLYPTMECETFWERVILPTMLFLIGFRYPSRLVNDPYYPDVAIANGQYLFFRREAYQRLGTHEVVKGSIVEDLELAKLAKQKGLRLQIVSAVSHFKVRMYTSFAELREGWTKNMFLSEPEITAAETVGRAVSLALLGMLPLLALILGYSLQAPAMFLLMAWVALLVMLLSVGVNRYFFRTHPWYALLHPLGMLLAAEFLLESRRRALSSTGVTWKARHFKSNPS